MKLIFEIIAWPFKFVAVNLYMWLTFFRSLFPHPKIKKGDQFIVVKDFQIDALTHYRAPCTFGFECVIPKDTILKADSDSRRVSLGFGAVPVNYKEFENEFVPKEQREDPKYAGYSIVFSYKDIGKYIKRL